MELRTENLTYEYDPDTSYAKKAIEDVNIVIGENEFIGLIGHTGSGKSTLIQHLNGLLKPTAGRVLWNGKDIFGEGFDRREFRGHVGLVFQYPEYQLFETDVLKDVCFGPKNLGLSDEAAAVRAKEALSLVGIGEELYKSSPFELSGGQKRRVAIAGVLAMRPDILILDEPTAGLDPKGRDEILGSVSQIRRETGSTVILVSHSMDDVAEYVDRVIVINKGRIEYDGITGEIFTHIHELEEMGLSAPAISYIMRDLKEAGFDIKGDALTVNEAADLILDCFRRGHV